MPVCCRLSASDVLSLLVQVSRRWAMTQMIEILIAVVGNYLY